MESVIEYAIKTGASLWAVLFVVLLAWVLKTNNDRERRYIETIGQLSKAVGDQEDVKEALNRIESHLLRRDA